MDLNAIENALSSLPLAEIRYFPTIPSTNQEAFRWAEQGAGDLSLVIADEQTAGRGRAGRKWFTPPGAALAFSLVLRLAQPEDPPRLMARLSALGGLAVCDALNQEYSLPAELKWPNDVLIRRLKTAGVLLESHWQGNILEAVILGVGVNVSSQAVPPAQDLLYPATSISEQTGFPVDRLALLFSILANLVTRTAALDSDNFFQDWEKYLAFKGEWVQIIEQGSALTGRLLGLNPDGSLRLSIDPVTELAIHTGDLRLRPL